MTDVLYTQRCRISTPVAKKFARRWCRPISLQGRGITPETPWPPPTRACVTTYGIDLMRISKTRTGGPGGFAANGSNERFGITVPLRHAGPAECCVLATARAGSSSVVGGPHRRATGPSRSHATWRIRVGDFALGRGKCEKGKSEPGTILVPERVFKPMCLRGGQAHRAWNQPAPSIRWVQNSADIRPPE